MSHLIPVAVLMGKVGVGKTTLYNKLCDTNHVATYSSTSLTRQLYRSEVTHGGNHFIAIDTPGTDSQDEVFKHSFLLKEALTNELVTAIFAMVQYNDRCASALDEFDKTISYLKPEYRDVVVVVVSKVDNAPQEHLEDIQADYREQFAQEGFRRVMFHSDRVYAISVAAQMLGLMQGMPKKQLEYEEADFLWYFRVNDESRAQKKVVGKLAQEAQDVLNRYRALIQSLGEIADKDDIIMSAIASSRYEVDEIYDKFIAEYGARMVDLDCYTSSITLQKIIDRAHREFREVVKEMMSYNPDDPNDWKNSIRKCQFCGEVWVKVSGCNGMTTCGNRAGGRDVTDRPWFRYTFWTDATGRFLWARTPDRGAAAAVQTASQTDSGSPFGPDDVFSPEDGEGCGRKIVWSDQPRLSEKELQKCLEVKGVDTLISSLQQQLEFREVMKSYVQDIDASFTK
mmetsp:Transcript_50720/g.157052  ORF Transcript_50720/g.157052 Transcript_50720/m.157052 type:complete len:454 (+) Transcript_50720:58-1419(+)